MFYRIVVPLDGSPRAESAIPVAARLARASHGTVIFMRSVETWMTLVPPAETTPFAPQPSLASELVEHGAAYLKRIAERNELAGVNTITRVVEGPAAESILELSQTERADLIVICARGVKGYHRWKLGGVTQHVIHHAQTPTLALNELTAGDPAGQFASVQRVLVPLDGSPLAETAIPAAIQLLAAQAPDTGVLHLVQVISPFASEELRRPIADLVLQANQYLQRLAERLNNAPTEDLRLTFTYEVLVDADAASAILTVAEPAREAPGAQRGPGYDLIALATHGRTGILRWSLGSITERVLQATELPLLIVRPAATAPRSTATPASADHA
jgi:nucleotide-binding universal stress UspA family protein